MFIIEDEWHAEWQDGQFSSLEEAVAELRRRADLAWDEPPNQAPCDGWETCGRKYQIIEYDDSASPWAAIRRLPALEVTAGGTRWLLDEAIPAGDGAC